MVLEGLRHTLISLAGCFDLSLGNLVHFEDQMLERLGLFSIKIYFLNLPNLSALVETDISEFAKKWIKNYIRDLSS